MSYDDNTFGKLFPTRHGTAIGGSGERQMLDAIDGANGFRKRFQTNSDGSVTMLQTRNGMPEFTTFGAPVASASVISTYMETGQLEYTLPGVENPSNSYPATWRFLDIPISEKWLGKILIKPVANIGEQALPQPATSGALYDGCRSLAIGYPVGESPVADDANRLSYEGYTIAKKLVARVFPPSLFPGKLRLFMQAQYGAVESSAFRFSAEVNASAVLRYSARSLLGGEEESKQFGFWSHLSHGIFTDDQFNYFLLEITLDNTSAVCVVTGYQIVLSATGLLLQEHLRTNTLSDDETKKIEAYILSDATIFVPGFHVGSFSSGKVGGTLCYGWKFDWLGHRASIVSVWQVGEPPTMECRSNEITLTINRDSSASLFSQGWSVTGVSTGEIRWIDGWGSWHIFAPVSESNSMLALFSARIGFSGALFEFSDAPVYGYYDSADNWVVVRVSHHIDNEATKYEQSQTGLVFREGFSSYYDAALWESDGNTSMSWSNVLNAKRRSDQDAAWEKLTIPAGNHTVSTISIGDYVYEGWRKSGFYTRSRWTTADEYIVSTAQDGGLPPRYDGENIGMPGIAEYTSVESFISSYGGYGAFAQFSFDNYHRNDIFGAESYEEIDAGAFEDINQWTLIIPAGDCSAVHMAKRELRVRDQSQHAISHWGIRTRYTTLLNRIIMPGNGRQLEGPFDLPYTFTSLEGDFSTTELQTHQRIVDTQNTTVDVWSTSVTAIPGSPSGSYGTLFSVDRDYPFFNGLIQFTESTGGRYAGTEVSASPSAVNRNLPFVGWV